MQMRLYAVEQAATLLGRVAFRANRAVKVANPDSIHDLRVAIRRFVQCLLVFRQFFPRRERKKIRRRLRRIMRIAAEVRNHDIAIDLCKKGGLPTDTALASRLKQHRELAKQQLAAQLTRLGKRDFSRKWRRKLQLQADG